MSAGIAVSRLTEERKNWRKDPPVGFYARPIKKADNSTDIMRWEAGIPGKEDSDWAGGEYKVILDFPPEYPSKPPRCKFSPPIFHPNVFSSGDICLSILKEESGWRPGITLKTLLLGIQDLLTTPNVNDPAHSEASRLLTTKPSEYAKRIKAQAAKMAPDT